MFFQHLELNRPLAVRGHQPSFGSVGPVDRRSLQHLPLPMPHVPIFSLPTLPLPILPLAGRFVMRVASVADVCSPQHHFLAVPLLILPLPMQKPLLPMLPLPILLLPILSLPIDRKSVV